MPPRNQHSPIPLAPHTLPRCAALLLAATAAALLAGCASMNPATPEQAVQERAQERWQALLAHDFGKAWTYLVPSYRAVVPLDRYKNSLNGGSPWVDVKVGRVQCESATKCTANVLIEGKPVGVTSFHGNIKTGVQETWLLEDGTWWLYQSL